MSASRPSRKFYRAPFREADVVNGISTVAGWNTALTTGMASIVALPELRDVDDQIVTGWGNMGLTTRRLGRDAAQNVPNAA